MSYKANKQKARFRNVDPTLTDQSQAQDTDVNYIIGKFRQTGVPPLNNKPGQYADISELPSNLRDAIEQARSVKYLRNTLPPELREKPVDELLALTPKDLADMLTKKPADPPVKEEDKK